MLDDDAFGAEHPVAIYGLHTAPYEVGGLGVTPGPMMGGRDRFTVTLAGSNGLAEAARAARTRLQDLATVAPSEIFSNQPVDFIALAMGLQQTAANEITISGTFSLASAASRRRAQTLVTSGLAALAPAGVTIHGSYTAKAIAGVTNDTALTHRATGAIQMVLGTESVRTVTGIVPAFSEDFGAFQAIVPGVFYFLGVSNAAKGWVGMPHAPGYVADESSIAVGARAMTAVLLERLGTP
jgi:amidohydrolase